MIARTAEASRIISEDRFRRNRVPLGRRGVPGTETLLGQSGAQEGQHAVSGYMAEGGKLQRVVAAGEFEGAEVRAVLAKSGQHLGRQLRQEGRVVLAVDHESIL